MEGGGGHRRENEASYSLPPPSPLLCLPSYFIRRVTCPSNRRGVSAFAAQIQPCGRSLSRGAGTMYDLEPIDLPIDQKTIRQLAVGSGNLAMVVDNPRDRTWEAAVYDEIEYRRLLSRQLDDDVHKVRLPPPPFTPAPLHACPPSPLIQRHFPPRRSLLTLSGHTFSSRL